MHRLPPTVRAWLTCHKLDRLFYMFVIAAALCGILGSSVYYVIKNINIHKTTQSGKSSVTYFVL